MGRAGGYIPAHTACYSAPNIEVFSQKDCYEILLKFSGSALLHVVSYAIVIFLNNALTLQVLSGIAYDTDHSLLSQFAEGLATHRVF